MENNADNHDNSIISSHPSGLSTNKPFRHYPSFNNLNHFKQINDLLVGLGKTEINWKIN